MEQITVNLLATGETPVCHVSQFDENRVVRINLKKGAEVYTLSGTETVKMRIRKPDKTERVVDITNTSSSYVDYASVPEDCDIAGVNVCELVIDGLGSKNFIMKVEEDAYGGGADIETLTASGPVATFETNMVDNLVGLKADIDPIQDLHEYDYPWAGGCGKNMFDIDSAVPGYIDGAGTNIRPPDKENLVSDFIPVVGGETYVYSFYPTTTGENWTGWAFYTDKDMSTVTVGARFVNYSNTVIPFRAPDDAKYVRIGSRYLSNGGYAQLEKGSTATEWTPYSNICPITGHTEAKIVHTGKNLIDDATKYAYSGNIVYIGQTDNNYRVFLKAGTYTVSVDFNGVPYGFYFKSANSANEKIWGSGSGITMATFVIPEDGYYRFWVYYNPNTETIDVNDLRRIQIELGSEVTDYEPYMGTEVTVQFGQTVYKGVLDAKNSKVILTSKGVKIQDRYWIYLSSYSYFQTTVSDIERNTNAARVLEGLMCEAYANRTPQQAGSGNINGSIAGFNDAIRIKDLAYNNPTDFVNAMGDYLIVYPLAEPIEVPLSAISQFETLLGVNNVYASTGDTEVKYLKQM